MPRMLPDSGDVDPVAPGTGLRQRWANIGRPEQGRAQHQQHNNNSSVDTSSDGTPSEAQIYFSILRAFAAMVLFHHAMHNNRALCNFAKKHGFSIKLHVTT